MEVDQIAAVSLEAETAKQITTKPPQVIQRRVETSLTDIQKLLEYYKTGALDELTRDQASDAIRILDLKAKRG